MRLYGCFGTANFGNFGDQITNSMKQLFSILFLGVSISLGAQDITGQWNGLLKVQGMQIRLVFHIDKKDAGFTGTMDSPDQGAKGIPLSSVQFESPKLTLRLDAAQIEYTGELKDDQVTGTFKQAGLSLPMDLKREAIEKPVVRRPQEPVKPYPYVAEEVVFENPKGNNKLAGTLTLPKKEGKFPAVILISGSGPQNRDEELLGHKPFLVIADYLTRNGIAVLRYDDRGNGQSTGDFKSATTADFATDAGAALAYLKTRKEIDPKKIGLCGHSEGGVIAPIVAAGNKSVGFIILLAGTGIPGDQLLLMQQELVGKANGMPEEDLAITRKLNSEAFELIKKINEPVVLKDSLQFFLKKIMKENPTMDRPKGMTDDQLIAQQMETLINPWVLYFLRYDPFPALTKVRCPVLALNGEKDLQVPPKENLAAIEKALKKARNKHVTIREFSGLNHLFQQCTTGSPDEYAGIEQTISPEVLKVISDWIQGL